MSDVLEAQLRRAEEALCAALLADPNNRAEAKSWLIQTVARLHDVPAATRLACFSPFSTDGSSRNGDRPSRSRSRSRDRYNSRQHAVGQEVNHHNHQHSDGRRSSSLRGTSPTRDMPDRRSRSKKQRYDDDGHMHHAGKQQQQLQDSLQEQQQQPRSPLQSCKPATLQLLQLLTDSQPSAVSQLLSQNSYFLCDYLTSSPATTNSWFSHFSLAGIQHFKFGARALANYALTRRSEVWQYLAWTGKHDQAPVAVAAKPHYFAELDLPKTLRNLAKYCPGFWESDELLKSCEGGEWLRLNPELITEELYRILYSPQSSREPQLQELVESYIVSADWSVLCNRLLLLLSEQQLLDFMKLFAQQQQQQQQRRLVAGSRAQQQQQQWQQERGPPSLLQQWLNSQVNYNAQHAVAQPLTHGTSSTAAAATELPCVAGLQQLVLAAANYSSSSSSSSSSLNTLLLTNALTCHQGQLLNLLKQDSDLGVQLLQMVAVAQVLFGDPKQQQQQQQLRRRQQQQEGEDESKILEPKAQKQGSEVLSRLQHLLSGKQAAPTAAIARAGSRDLLQQQQLQPLVILGWLLRLQLLLAAGGGGGGWDQLQHALQQLGCRCEVLQEQHHHQQQHHQQQKQHQQQQHAKPQERTEQQRIDLIGKEAADLTQQQGDFVQQQQLQIAHESDQQQALKEQPQQQQQWQGEHGEQQQQQGEQPAAEIRKPLRRGPTVAADQQHDLAANKQKVKHRHSKTASRKQKHHKRAHRKRERGSSSTSSPDSSDDSDAGSGSSKEADFRKASKRHRHKGKTKHRSRRRRRRSSSSGSSSSGGSSGTDTGSEIDYDAGGRLLDPEDFQQQQQQQQLGGSTAPLAAAAAGGDSSSRGKPTAEVMTVEQQEQLSGVLSALEGVSIGSRLWSSPRWLVGLPADPAAAVSADGRYVWVVGTAAQIADAVAWYFVWTFTPK